jgi:hypothetical protein
MKDILEAKRRPQQELIDAVRAASPEELEASAERIKAVRALKGGRRQRMAPPAEHGMAWHGMAWHGIYGDAGDGMTDQDRVALKFFRNLMRLWSCTNEQQIRILGSADQVQFDNWQTAGLPHDVLLRISHLMAIHRALRTIFGGNPAAYGWISRQNQAPPFGGRAALELLIEGHFVAVREYLERQAVYLVAHP